MFGPGGILFLLQHEMLLTWRNFRASGKGRHVRRLVFYTVITGVLGFGGYWVARLLSAIEPHPTPLALGIAGAVFAILFTFMLSQALMLITESLYQRGDLDLLLASPLPPWRILMVRMAAIAINVSLLYVILALAVFVWLPFFGGWAWMSFAPSILLLALFATAVGLVLARLMFWTMGPKNTRVVAQIVASIIGAAFFLATQAQNFVPRGDRAAAFRAVMEHMIPVLGDTANPLSLPARAAFGVSDAFAIWAAIGIGGYLLAVWWYASRFVEEAAAIAGVGARRRRRDVSARRMRSGVAMSLVRKEWRLLLRDPLLLSQILLQLLYLLPLFFVFASRLGQEGAGRLMVAGFATAFVLLSTSLAGSLAWLTVSAEDAPDLIAAAPVPRDTIENAKAFAAAAPPAALLLPPVIGTAVMISPMAGIWLLIGGAAAISSTCLIAVWHQQPGNRKEFRRRSRGSILLNFGRSFVAFGWMGATALAVAGQPLLAIVPAIIALGLVLALHESRQPRD
jgi:ABC-2 type transport system permease protein